MLVHVSLYKAPKGTWGWKQYEQEQFQCFPSEFLREVFSGFALSRKSFALSRKSFAYHAGFALSRKSFAFHKNFCLLVKVLRSPENLLVCSQNTHFTLRNVAFAQNKMLTFCEQIKSFSGNAKLLRANTCFFVERKII